LIVVLLKVVWLATTTKSKSMGDGCQSVSAGGSPPLDSQSRALRRLFLPGDTGDWRHKSPMRALHFATKAYGSCHCRADRNRLNVVEPNPLREVRHRVLQPLFPSWGPRSTGAGLRDPTHGEMEKSVLPKRAWP
jgi:hypothetical protein